MNLERKVSSMSDRLTLELLLQFFSWMLASAIISSKACLLILKIGLSARQQGQTLRIGVIPRSVASLQVLLLVG